MFSRLAIAMGAVGLLSAVGGAVTYAAPKPTGADITYRVPDGPGYTVKQGGNGVVKVTAKQCVQSGKVYGLTVQLGSAQSGSGLSALADFKFKATGGTISFVPPSLTIVPGQTQQVTVNLVADPAPTSGGSASFRFKAVPTPGSGIGEGPGVMIELPCVLDPPPTPTQNSTNGTGTGTGSGNGTGTGTGTGSGTGTGTGTGTGSGTGSGNGTGSGSGTGGGTGTGTGTGTGSGNGSGTGTGTGSATPCPSAAQHPLGIATLGGGQVNPAPTARGTLRRVIRNCILERRRSGAGSLRLGTLLRVRREFPPTLGAFAPLVPLVRALPARCVNVRNEFPVRAGQRNTITVRVRKRGVLMHYARVRITGPGVRQTKSTGAHGAATFAFIPSGAGPLYVQSDACIGVDTVPVLFAKSTTSSTPPANTG